MVQYGTTQLNTGTNRNAEQWRYTASYFSGKMRMYTMPNCVDLINLGRLREPAQAQVNITGLKSRMLTDQYGSVVNDFYNGVSGINLVLHLMISKLLINIQTLLTKQSLL
ncbi:hypothetical protein CS542_04980 [Pedobacter sp. IW39]|nr:hypothetical protein CS542_04980 [Pedobacter sp. IW39]